MGNLEQELLRDSEFRWLRAPGRAQLAAERRDELRSPGVVQPGVIAAPMTGLNMAEVMWHLGMVDPVARLSVAVVIEAVAQALDDVMSGKGLAAARGLLGEGEGKNRDARGARQEYLVSVEVDPAIADKRGWGWYRWAFGGCMTAVEALAVSGKLALHWSEDAAVRVVVLDDGDSRTVVERGAGFTRYGAREWMVWRCGVMDPSWRPVVGRKAAALERRDHAATGVIMSRGAWARSR
jgi:hypothetical protein